MELNFYFRVDIFWVETLNGNDLINYTPNQTGNTNLFNNVCLITGFIVLAKVKIWEDYILTNIEKQNSQVNHIYYNA
jgi:hypothetical protein